MTFVFFKFFKSLDIFGTFAKSKIKIWSVQYFKNSMFSRYTVKLCFEELGTLLQKIGSLSFIILSQRSAKNFAYTVIQFLQGSVKICMFCDF